MATRLRLTLLCVLFTVVTAHAQEDTSTPDAAAGDTTEATSAPVAEAAAPAASKDKPEKTEAEKEAEKAKAIAKALKKKSKYPVSGSVGTSYTANHANFVDSEGDFGTQLISVNGSVNFAAHKHLSLSTGVSARKSIVNDYFSRGAATSTSEQPWEIGDISLGASFGKLYTIPVAKIGVTANSSLTFPLSRTSQAYGLLASGSASTALGWRRKNFNIGLSFRANYNVTEDSTIAVDCIRAPDICRISGADTGIPVSRVNYSTGLAIGYRLLDKKLSLGANYGLSSGIGAVEFEGDDNTSPYAQIGTQYGALAQSFGLSVGYRVLKKTNVSLSMRTSGTFYTNDNQSWRMPLFDTESDLHARTSYTLSVNQSF